MSARQRPPAWSRDASPLPGGKMKLRKKPFKPTWKALVQINPKFREEDWDQFISRAYWEVELES